MNELPADVGQWAFDFMMVLARIGASMAVLPGMGEATPPAMVRIGVALSITLLLLPELQAAMPQVPEASPQAVAMVASEVVTGLWFGWLARVTALALPAAAQFIAYLMGLTSVLQPDPTLGPQTTALAGLANITAPLILLVSGLYALPLEALSGLYQLIPPGTLLPASSSADLAVHVVTQAFALSVRLASPFIVAGIIWHVTIGLIARLVPRIQIYFVSMPGQILGGILLLASLGSAILAAWQDGAREAFATLPGAG